jgi:uncharacterized protein YbaP (TraB family)
MRSRFFISAIFVAASVLSMFHEIAVSGEIAAVARSADDEKYEKGLLWQIRSDGATSYIFGTMHSEHPAVARLPEQVQDAFSQVDRVVLEIVLDRATIARLSDATRISDGPNLPSLLGPALYQQVSSAMEEYGIPSHALNDMKPWAVATTLLTPKSNTGLFLDRVLYLEALAKGKPVIGLETADEQMAAFEDMPIEMQVALVRDSLELVPRRDGLYAEMRERYVARDLAGLADLNDSLLDESDPELADMFMQKIIVDRNHRMAERLDPYLKKGTAFVAIGALHLPGEDGLLNLLAQRGYDIEVIY